MLVGSGPVRPPAGCCCRRLIRPDEVILVCGRCRRGRRIGIPTMGHLGCLKRMENALALSIGWLIGPVIAGVGQYWKAEKNNMSDRRFCIAPMMDWTD
jgi:hypothetical protein